MTDIPPPPMPPQPGFAAGPSDSKNNLGTWALVLGILSIVCCGLFAGIPAIIVGNKSKEAAAQGLATNGNLGQVGFILGIIGSVLSVLGGVFYGIAAAAGAY
ncbi:DUF4190 domain-containing protein [Demequina zhanjiangensis]|uniref:DUF4190 domain-containing protein n=1 Tax=Demequina zhanjiangensis TaxID=3051659 RepID=A0ABT8G1X5_9MICO|nr:DUF4190 domain-containing protein [Demequina sp. SYSU T00b26]MDN4473138.1 DUF4190 domain-containing protein [Demequina sp. SYSU T00b26]